MLILTLFWAFIAQAHEEHLKMIPADMNIVVGVNLEQILAIPLLKQQYTEEDAKELAEVGLAIEDFKSATIAASYSEDMDMQDFSKVKGIMILEFNKSLEQDKIIAMIEKEANTKVTKEQLGREIFVAKDGDETIGFFFDGNTVVAGPVESVRDTVRVLNGSVDNISKNTTMRKLLVPNGMVYAAGILKGHKEFNGFSMNCSYKEALNLKAKLYCKNQQIATETAEGMKMMADMMMGQMQLTEKNLKIGVAGTAMTLDINGISRLWRPSR